MSWKKILDIDFYDNLNLNENNLFLNIKEKYKSKKSIRDENGYKYFYGISISDYEDEGFVKLNSLYDLQFELRKNEFVFDSPHWEKRARYIQGYLEL